MSAQGISATSQAPVQNPNDYDVPGWPPRVPTLPGFDPIPYDPRGPSWSGIRSQDKNLFDLAFVAQMDARTGGRIPSMNQTRALQDSTTEAIKGVGPVYAERLSARGYPDLLALAAAANRGPLDLTGIPSAVGSVIMAASRALISSSSWARA